MPLAPEDPLISVVIPVHNEATYLPGALADLFAEISEVPVAISVLIAENGSTDATAEVVTRLAPRYPGLTLLELPEPDYGAAMRAGFLETVGDWVVNFDIDYFSGAFLETVLSLKDEADLVIASKRVPGSDDRRSSWRRLATLVFNLLLRYGLGSDVSDTHGMKALRRSVVDELVPEVVSTQDLFDTELVLRAERSGYRIAEVPVTVEERRETRSSLLRRVPRTLAGLWRIRRLLNRGGQLPRSASAPP